MGRVPTTVLAVQLVVLGLGGASAGSVAAQDATPDTASGPLSVEVQLRDTDNVQVGTARLIEGPSGAVTVTVSVEDLTPGEHGIHVHETGVCDSSGEQPFSSAGDHFNPSDVGHGGPTAITGALATPASGGARDVQAFDTSSPVADEPDVLATPEIAASPAGEGGHAGDLGNIVGPNEGAAAYSIVTDRFTLSEGATSLQDEDGSALIIHADRDDLTTDPGGNSGDRIICGVIYPPAN